MPVNLFPVGSIFDDQYAREVQMALGGLQTAQTRIGEDKGLSEYEYGYTDNSNPYSQVKLQARQQGIDATQQMNAAAGRRQIRSGAYQTQRANLVFGQGQERDNLRSRYDLALRGFTRAGEDAQSGFDTTKYQAGEASLYRKLNAPPVDPGETDPAPAAAGPPNPLQNDWLKRTVKGGTIKGPAWSGGSGVIGAPAPKKKTRPSNKPTGQQMQAKQMAKRRKKVGY